MAQLDLAATRPSLRRAAAPTLARPVVRVVAYLVDWLVGVIAGCLTVSAGGLVLYFASDRGRAEAPDAAVYAFLVVSALAVPLWLGITLAGWSRAGRSVGKLAFGLRIVDRRGRPPGLLRALIRLAVFVVESALLLLLPALLALRSWLDGLSAAGTGALLLFWLAGVAAVLPALLTRSGRTLHDLAAGTLVVEE